MYTSKGVSTYQRTLTASFIKVDVQGMCGNDVRETKYTRGKTRPGKWKVQQKKGCTVTKYIC
jgi:hypothetical protein